VGLAFGANDIIALTQFVRTRSETAAMPIVVLGTPTEAQQKDKLSTAGVTNFLPSPVDPEQAGAMIKGLYSEYVDLGSPGRQVKGSFDELGSYELASLLGRGRHSGKLLVRNGNVEGHLQLEKGKVMFATWANKPGPDAVKQILNQPQAEFVYEPEAPLTDMPNLDKDLEVLVKELKPKASAAAAQE
jgi:hypothetical protein